MTNAVRVRSVRVGDRRTSMRLDEDSWSALGHIADLERTSISKLLTEIDRSRGDTPLARATRAYIVRYLRQPPSGDRSDAPATGAARLSEMKQRHKQSLLWSTGQDGATEAERKLQFALDRLPRIETGRIPRHWKDWVQLSRELGHPPSLEAFAARSLGPIAADDSLNILDIEPENPFHFCGIRINSGVERFVGRALSGEPIGTYPFQVHARGMQADFNEVKMTALPAYHVIWQRFGNLTRTFARLTLPLCDAVGRVDRLVTIIRRIEPIHPVAPT